MQIKNLALSEISHHQFFRFRNSTPPQSLITSIKKSGVLSPIIIHDYNEPNQIIAGFCRFNAAVQLDLKEIPCHLYPKTISLQSVFYHSLLEHASIHHFKLIEKARILDILSQLELSWKEIVPFLSLLELPRNQEIVKQLQSLLLCHSAMTAYFEKYDFSLKQTLPLLDFPQDAQEKLAKLGLSMQIRSVELLQIGTMIHEIALRNEQSFIEKWKELSVDKHFEDETYTRSQRIDILKKQLNALRFPKLTSWQKEIKQNLKNMHLPPHLQINWDRTLEKSGLQLQINLKDISEYQDLKDWLSDPDVDTNLEKILKVLK